MNSDPEVAPEKGTIFAALLVYEALSSASDDEPLYEETVTLFVAESVEDATRKARLHGENRETSYDNADGDTITWKLKHVLDVAEVDDDPRDDGAEIYTRHFRNYRAYEMFEALLGKTQL
ncbi:DUF4288 domain-containing protein [Amycolatopsis sp. NPDC051071]|uniref:DUF4288 domain-containing protein n=1 Tax=Amycolatopsis sp. NPDC051071 TaxID=3154637 RepID=UPI00343A357D